MPTGWRSTPPASLWLPPPGMRHATMLLVPIAVILFISARAPTDIKRLIRHPQLTGVKLWAVAHLLVNGDSASLLLFGGLLVWAVLEVVIINQQDGKPRLKKPQPSLLREFAAIVITLLIYGVTAYLHGLLGYPVHG